MIHLTNIVDTFPSVKIPNDNGGLPVEVSLIAQLGHGAGNHLFSHVAARQTGHAEFIDELDEPSAKLGGTHFDLDDTTSLYSFIVGPKGHPFHRHAGHRIFTAVSCSGGAQLRFSTATEAEIKENPHKFIDHLHFINIPPDCLFTVRFGGETWHQFWPLSKNSLHPVFFALSCHTDELGGNLPEELKEKIKANKADIPSLTELLPDEVSKLIHSKNFKEEIIPTTTLSLDAAAGTVQRKVCDSFRGKMGILRGAWGNWYGSGGYITQTDLTKTVIEMDKTPVQSLLREHLKGVRLHHEDTFMLSLKGIDFKTLKAENILELLLEGFLMNAPCGVSRLMLLRNVLVKPLGLRTSPLGCPVSSLLSEDMSNLFAQKYPVLDKKIEKNGSMAQVILGANDKHLQFRSCVGVELVSETHAKITLGTRVHCRNLFGRVYMSAIDYTHRKYITPTMLRRATDYILLQIK
mgnify:CR=1 FL=1|tara:strand:+ start:1371 stop:2759 length:1389 start_codon:yes stop_codon:yes gene_type:complete